jgi:TPR repeat protein
MASRDELAIIRGARAGQAAAQLALGRLYLFGSTGLPQNKLTALHWLVRAARQEVAEAWELIAAHIEFDCAMQSEQPMALCEWYERAYAQGNPEAGLVLAKLVLAQEPESVAPALLAKAMQALASAAQAGLAQAQWLLAQQGGGVGTPGEAGPDWALRAASGGVTEAQFALMEAAWERGDHGEYLRWALPLARNMLQQVAARVPELVISREQVTVLVRCAQAIGQLDADAPDAADLPVVDVPRLWELAAQLGDRTAQLWLGLWYARMNAEGERVFDGPATANFKKSIRWLTQAGEQGLGEAWFALSRIYLKPEFSQRSVDDAQIWLERAASMGHALAQFEMGSIAWRNRREMPENEVKAAYWLQKAAAQGVASAMSLLEKIAPPSKPLAWAVQAKDLLTRVMSSSYPFLVARIELALAFGLSRAEALMLDINQADQGHCLVVDIRAHYGRAKRRLVMVETAFERQLLDRVARLFVDVDCSSDGPEGNYRQRLYRLKTLLPQLDLEQAA